MQTQLCMWLYGGPHWFKIVLRMYSIVLPRFAFSVLLRANTAKVQKIIKHYLSASSGLFYDMYVRHIYQQFW
jgi:hypothetical protein